MKERILDSLYDFALEELPEKSQSLFQELVDELNIPTTELKEKSRVILKTILHNYAYFDVSTIDKFTHRIIRSFAKDLKLPQNFEPVVDTDLLLDEAISRVLQKAGEDRQLTQVIIDFALEKIENERSWDITFDLTRIGQLSFNENHSSHLERLSKKSIPDFTGLKKVLLQKIASLEKEMTTRANDTLKNILESGLQFEDFTRQTLPNHFKNFVHQKFEPSKLYNNKLQENLENDKVLKSGVELPTNDFITSLHRSYLILRDLVYSHSYLKNIYNNVTPLAILNTIQQEIDKIGKERDQIPIFKFNQIISEEINDQPAPFIYERLGEKYRHYFIDEFQDTSAVQWNNLVPLIDNALSAEGGSLFLVGDGKQAIYRWRGGKAEQLLDLYAENDNPFVIRPVTKNLPKNFRSYSEIIKFNNDFFGWSSKHLDNQMYRSMFHDGNNQEPNTKKGGAVSIHFLEKEKEKNIDALYCYSTFLIINEIAQKGHPLSDICVLVRSNKKGTLMADYLTEKRLPIISSESLLLRSSEKIRFLINLLRYGSGPYEKELSYEVLCYLAPKTKGRHEFIKKNLDTLKTFLKKDYGFDLDSMQRFSVYDSFEYAIRQFKLAPTSDAYIVFLMDFALEVEQKVGVGAHHFLAHWEKKKEKLAITSSKNTNAIKIMTIHKAKGLEFPIVIFPFADELIYNRREKKMWVPSNSSVLSGFDQVLLNEKEEVAEYSDEASSVFQEEKEKMQLDALNVLYVALTRAEKAVFILSEKKSNSAINQKINRYSDLFSRYLMEKGLWNDGQSTYNFGELAKNTIKEESQQNTTELKYQYTFKDRPDFKIVTKGASLLNTDRGDAIEHGNLIHYILGLIKTHNDLDKAIEEVIRQGDLDQDQIKEVRGKVEQVLYHPHLYEFFDNEYDVFNERDILKTDGSILRPDRIMVCGNEASVIDYKTGLKNPRYKEQLYTYSNALGEMGFTVKNRIIIYIGNEIKPEFI